LGGLFVGLLGFLALVLSIYLLTDHFLEVITLLSGWNRVDLNFGY
jgi:hypothetical protein